jgi:hypothetical protein
MMVNDLTLALFGEKALDEKITLKQALTMLQELELINIGELAEKAISKKTGIDQVERCFEGCDLVNGWEIKHGQAREQKSGTVRRAYVSGLENKTTTLRVVITELLTGRLYFFKVPFRAYRDCRGSSINWDFDLDGTPRRQRLREGYRANFWDFEVASFDELCS